MNKKIISLNLTLGYNKGKETMVVLMIIIQMEAGNVSNRMINASKPIELHPCMSDAFVILMKKLPKECDARYDYAVGRNDQSALS